MNSKKIILLATLAIIGILGVSQMAYAATPTLSAIPSNSTKNINEAFNVSVNIIPQGEKACVVKGIVNFSNLTCKSININPSLMLQTTPTCLNPKFVVGIPGCTVGAKNILTISVKGNEIGNAKLSFADVKVLGEGTDVASLTNDGTYNITAIESAQTSATNNEEVVQPQTTETPEQTEQNANTDLTQNTNTEDSVPAIFGIASLSSIIGYKYFWPLLILFIVLCIGYGIYYFVKNRKVKK